MNNSIELLLALIAVAAGLGIGLLFGTIQNLALQKNKKRYEQGNLKTGWVIMPGSFSRIAVLLVVLALIQVGCPFLFKGNIQWLISAGILIGYGLTFVKQLKQREVYRK